MGLQKMKFGKDKTNIKNKVLKIVKKEIIIDKEEKPKDKPKKIKWKLDLNTLLLNNKSKVQSIFVNWWRKDTTKDMKDLISFVLIHGSLVAPCFFTILTLTNIDINIIKLIKESPLITFLIYLIGGGSSYYLFIDVNKALEEIWRKKRK